MAELVVYEDLWSKELICGNVDRGPDHILIAGRTGAGKSTIMNNLIYSVLCAPSGEHSMVLIDPKVLEFDPYHGVPHEIWYAETYEQIVDVLRKCYLFVNKRFESLRGTGKKLFEGTRVHIFIDELMVIMTGANDGRAKKYLQQILTLARAANVQVIMATQCPKANIIPTEIKANCGVIIGLQTRSGQDSRNIIGVKGCENLPRVGKALVQDPDNQEPHVVELHKVAEEHIEELVAWRLDGN